MINIALVLHILGTPKRNAASERSKLLPQDNTLEMLCREEAYIPIKKMAFETGILNCCSINFDSKVIKPTSALYCRMVRSRKTG